jgi:hypothetical protein
MMTLGSDSLPAQTLDTPMTRMRPIGTSATDRSASRHVARLQQPAPVAPGPAGSGIGFPPGGLEAPPIVPSGNLPNNLPIAPSTATPSSPPRALPANPPASGGVGGPLPSVPNSPAASDAIAVPQPQLGGQFATIGNCACVSAPSNYSAAMGGVCGTTVRPVGYSGDNLPASTPAYVPPAAEVAPSVVLPDTPTVPLSTPLPPSAAPKHALISFGQPMYPVEVGPGLWGQPVAYVPGQRIRNCIRYFFP